MRKAEQGKEAKAWLENLDDIIRFAHVVPHPVERIHVKRSSEQ
jgi:hypothetical protein